MRCGTGGAHGTGTGDGMAVTDVRVIRVVLVDDHPLVRAGLSALLGAADDMTVVGEAADGAQAVKVAERLDTDVVLMDLSMPVMDGVAATRAVLARKPDVRVVVLSSYSDHGRVRDAVEAGATGYVLKDSSPDEVLSAVRSAAAGHAPLDPRVAAALLPSSSPHPADGLSERERQVLRLASTGMANKQIGRSLGIA